MLGIASSPVLVAGMSRGQGGPVLVEVLRPICVRGERQEIGTVLELRADVALELVGAGSVKLATRTPEPAPEVAETAADDAPPPVPHKGKRNARK